MDVCVQTPLQSLHWKLNLGEKYHAAPGNWTRQTTKNRCTKIVQWYLRRETTLLTPFFFWNLFLHISMQMNPPSPRIIPILRLSFLMKGRLGGGGGCKWLIPCWEWRTVQQSPSSDSLVLTWRQSWVMSLHMTLGTHRTHRSVKYSEQFTAKMNTSDNKI